LDFFVDTYETPITRRDREREATADDGEDYARLGRPINERIRYLDRHPKAEQVHRVLRSDGHRNLPNIVGQWFTARNDPDTYDLYCASMQMLLKPWRNISTDLKFSSETWVEAFDKFVSVSSPRIRNLLSGTQYLHECESAAKQNDGTPTVEGAIPHDSISNQYDNSEMMEVDGFEIPRDDIEYTEEGLIQLIKSLTSVGEEWHARIAVEIGRYAHIFQSDVDSWSASKASSIRKATGDDIRKLLLWKQQMSAEVAQQNPEYEDTSVPDTAGASVTQMTDVPADAQVSLMDRNEFSAEAPLTAVDPSVLKPDQRRAYDIAVWHLEETLAGKDPPPLRMIVYGEGGTGKSKVIQTITDAFDQRGLTYLLVKSAYTGVAASLIDGKTTHTIAHFSLNANGNVSGATKKKLQQFWKNRRYVVQLTFS
jgi:PIF1-like helicase